MRLVVLCPCGKEFQTSEAHIKVGRGKYCSMLCKYKYRIRPSGLTYKITEENAGWFKKGVHSYPESGFQKGLIPTNFKGDSVGYDALHDWVNRHKGKAARCCHCGTKRNVHWANVSHEYRRDLSDYMSLCVSCHRKYDFPHKGSMAKRFGNKNK